MWLDKDVGTEVDIKNNNSVKLGEETIMKRLIALALCATMMLCGAPIAAFAADVDDMTLDELKEAYLALAAENEDLKNLFIEKGSARASKGTIFDA